jgi:hypothetical protein
MDGPPEGAREALQQGLAAQIAVGSLLNVVQNFLTA